MNSVLVILYYHPLQATLSVILGLSHTSYFPLPAGFLWVWRHWWELRGRKQGREGCFFAPLSCREPWTALAQLLTSFCSPNTSLQQPLGGAPISGVTDFLNIHSPTRLSFHPGSVHMGEERSGCETVPGILVSSNTSSSLLLLRPGQLVISGLPQHSLFAFPPTT